MLNNAHFIHVVLTYYLSFYCSSREIHRYPNSLISRQLRALPDDAPQSLKFSRSYAHFPTILRFLEDGKEALYYCEEIQKGKISIHEV